MENTVILIAGLTFACIIAAIGAFVVDWIAKHAAPVDLREFPNYQQPCISPLLREALKRDKAFTASVENCANHVGRAYVRPAFVPAPGYFWKRDTIGNIWRLYRIDPRNS